MPARVASPEDLGEAAYDPVDEHDTIVSVFSGVARKGRWEPPARIRVYSLFGGADLDFCEADMLEGTTRVDVFVLFGGAQIRVPTDIDVDCRGLGIFGHFAQLSQRGDDPQPPRLLIRGTALFGGIDVKGPKRKRLRFGRRKR